MTIREVEQRTGLERATVRFYEKEGLLTPKRLENGYRDYSEEDVATLLRIKLLRELDVSIEDIRALQRGEQALPDTLAKQIFALERRMEETAYTRDTCCAIRDEGVSYAQLDAAKYLDRVQPPSRVYVADRDKPKSPYCPWRRFFARMLDLNLYALVWGALLAFVFRSNLLERAGVLEWIDLLMALLMMLFLEPLWLKLWGTTPGKALFGLRVESEDGRRLDYFDGLNRTAHVLWYGMGFQIPVYNLVRLWKSYKQHGEGEMSWDEGYSYEVKEWALHRGLCFVLAMAAIVAATTLMALAGRIPPHRGELTVEEFAENFNFLHSYYNVNTNDLLSTEGQWTNVLSNGSYVVSFGGENPDFSYTEEDGRVTAVHITQQNDAPHTVDGELSVALWDSYIYWPDWQIQFAAIAFAAGEGHGLWLHTDELANAIAQAEPFEDFSITACGVTVRCEVEYSGYNDGMSFLIAQEGEAQNYSLNCTIELAK